MQLLSHVIVMATKKIETTDKYAGYRYEIVTPEELREANWMIEQGMYKNMEHYIDSATRMEISLRKQLDTEKIKRSAVRKKRRIDTLKKDKAA